MTETKYRTCNLCEAMCGLAIEVDGNQVVSIRPDQDDVLSHGHICPKAFALQDVNEDPDRLRLPLRKIDGDWQQVSWAEAYAYTAKRIVDIQQAGGRDALAVYAGNPSVHNTGTLLFAPVFRRLLRTKSNYSATSVDQLTHHLAALMMFGQVNLLPVPDINRTDFWLILGGNPLVSNGSMMTAPNVSGKLRAIQQRGGKVVVIDPRRTETAKKADQHLFITPGTDIWLLLALINLVFTHDAVTLGHLADKINMEQLLAVESAVAHITPAVASRETGIPGAEIEALAAAFLQANTAVCYGRLGVSAAQHGGLCQWAVVVLNLITGNLDAVGGSMFPSAPIDIAARKARQAPFKRWQSRTSGQPEAMGEVPAQTLAEDITTPGTGQIKGLVTICGNPVLSVPNGARLDAAMETLDFMVSVDIYLNETTRHADVILPPATGLEAAHFGFVFHNLAVHNTAKFSSPTIEKDPDAKFDWEIFSDLSVAVAQEQAARNGEDYTPQALPTLEDRLDMMLHASGTDLTIAALKEAPHGVDRGALVPNIGKRLLTDSGQIEVFPAIYAEGLANLAPTAPTADLLLIGRRHLRTNNSWLHNVESMVRGRNTCTAMLHPADAAAHKITDGSLIEVTSRVGSVTLPAEITADIAQGVVSIPHGWGHKKEGIRLRVAQGHAGVSINDLVDDQVFDAVSGSAVINAVPVTVALA